ncbi:MAG: helix-turn-helix domain-containing protein [Saprospiraceae bacterium]
MKDSNTVKLIFGAKVAYLRHQRGLSYQELGQLTGLSGAYLHEIEKGKKYPKADKIMALAQAFGVPFEELVSVYTSKKLQPIVELLESDWLKAFPVEELFGLNTGKLMELFSNTPDKVNAFISTVVKMARNYQLQTEHFFNAALRSYQDLHDNYFAELEKAAEAFRQEALTECAKPYPTSILEQVLREKFNINIDRKTLAKNVKLAQLRSVYSPNKKILYINKNLSEAQQNFLIGREIAFQYLQLEERPYETVLRKAETFDILLNNFKASYFSSALLMSEQDVISDVYALAQLQQWDNQLIFKLLQRYNVTPEMFLQRLTNILPKHFEVKDLFFLRINSSEDLKNFTMDKELHLSRLHSPYANQSHEHYCHRWASIKVLKRLRATGEKGAVLADAQISQYWETDNAYFILSLGKLISKSSKVSVSVTLGLLITEKLKSLFRFLNDPKLTLRIVNTTCERCSVPDCDERAAPPVFIERMTEMKELEDEVKQLIRRS